MVVDTSVGYQSQPRNISKVRSTLRQFVREWSAEGEEERRQCFQPVIDALKKYAFFPISEMLF